MERKEDKIKRVTQMLENASNILRGTESTENSQVHQTSGFNTHALSSNTTQVSSSNVRRALDHVRNMIRSSTGGLHLCKYYINSCISTLLGLVLQVWTVQVLLSKITVLYSRTTDSF